jgi:hypothetical protein
MSTLWAQKREELLSDCLVSPDVFHQIIDRLAEFVVPYQQALEADAAHAMHLYLQGLLSHLPHKNAEEIATLVDVERQLIQDFIGVAPWEHRPLVTVLVVSFRQARLTFLLGSATSGIESQRPALDRPVSGASRASTPHTSQIPPRDQSQP